MKDKNEEEYSIGESSSTIIKDHELFRPENHIPHKVVRVKRVTSKGAEDWRIIEDGDTTLTLKGVRFNNKEKEFLRTPEGFRYVMDGYKKGWRSVSKFKQNLELT